MAVTFLPPDEGPAAVRPVLELDVTPGMLTVDIQAEPPSIAPRRIGFTHHPAERVPGFEIELRSQTEATEIYRLYATYDTQAHHPAWVTWSYVARDLPDEEGGESSVIVDRTIDEGREVKILVSGRETRRLRLEAVPVLDGQTFAGNYPLTLHVHRLVDDQWAHFQTKMVLVQLRHPESVLFGMLPSIYREAIDELRHRSAEQELPHEATLSENTPSFKANRPIPGFSLEKLEELRYQAASPFFVRYLRGFDDAIEPLKQTLGRLNELFGPYSTPTATVAWLAAWVCMPMDENWPEMKRRLLVAKAVELFSWRGTKRGLADFIEIYAGARPEILDEPFVGMTLGPDALLGTDKTVIGHIETHTFVVTLAVPDPATIDESVLHGIIQIEKPAHTAYRLNVIRRAT